MPYRDDEHALRAKKQQLEQDRAHIDEQKRALEHLADDEKRVRRELADIEQRLAKRRKTLPLLEEVRVASPCSADWNGMVGDEQSRFCDKCAKNVYNLSAMTTDEAEALIREKEGKLCVRYFQRSDGTVLTADCSVGVRRKRVKAAVFVTAVGAAAGMGANTFAHSFVQGDVERREMRMGKLEAFDVDEVSDQIVDEIRKSPLRTELGCGTCDAEERKVLKEMRVNRPDTIAPTALTPPNESKTLPLSKERQPQIIR